MSEEARLTLFKQLTPDQQDEILREAERLVMLRNQESSRSETVPEAS